MAVDGANRERYQLGHKVITVVPFTVVAQSKAIILGRQPLYTVPAPSTEQVGIFVLPPMYPLKLIRGVFDDNKKDKFIQFSIKTYVLGTHYAVMILSFWTDMSGQTVQTQIRLLLEEQSDQGLHCLQFCLCFVLLIILWYFVQILG